MPTWTDNDPPRQQDPDRQPPGRPEEAPRDFETPVRDDDRNHDARFDADLNRIADGDDINTHGSER